MIPALLATNNSTLAYEDGGAGGTATGAGALRYRDGYFAGSSAALVEEATTNNVLDPTVNSGAFATGWAGGAKDDAFGHDYGRSYTGTLSAKGNIRPNNNKPNPVTPDGTVTFSAWVYSSTANTINGFSLRYVVDGSRGAFSDEPQSIDVPANTWTRIVGQDTAPSGTTVEVNDWWIIFANAATVWVTEAQIESKDHVTTFCPELDGSGNLLPGYAWTGTAHNSPSTRAAASITIPYSGTVGSLACWYSEDLGQTWSWHYAEALGSIGTYGDISDDGNGNLVITSDRALLLGPLAVWTDTLSAGQQAGVQAYSDVWTWADISSVPVTLDTAMTAAGTSAATLDSAVTLATAGTAAGTSTATMSAELARLLDTSMVAAGSSTATLGTTMDLLTAMLAAGTSTAVMHPEAGPLPQLGLVTYTERPRPVAATTAPRPVPLAAGYVPRETPIAAGYVPRPPSED